MTEIIEMKSNLSLIKDDKIPVVNQDLIELLEILSNEAKLGELQGLVFTSLYSGDGYKLGISLPDEVKFHYVLGILTEQVMSFMDEVAKDYE